MRASVAVRAAAAALVLAAASSFVACGNDAVPFAAGKIFGKADLPHLVLTLLEAPAGSERVAPAAAVSLGEIARRRSEEIPLGTDPPGTEKEERRLRARLKRHETMRLETLGFLGAYEASFQTEGFGFFAERPGVFIGSSVHLFRRPEASSAALQGERVWRRGRIAEQRELERAVGAPPRDPGDPPDSMQEVELAIGEEFFGVEERGGMSFRFSYLWRVGNALFFLEGGGFGEGRLDRGRARALAEKVLTRAR